VSPDAHQQMVSVLARRGVEVEPRDYDGGHQPSDMVVSWIAEFLSAARH